MTKPNPTLAQTFLRPEDLAQLLGCSTRTVRSMVSDGQIPSPTRFGRLTRWRSDEIQDWLADRKQNGAQQCAKGVQL